VGQQEGYARINNEMVPFIVRKIVGKMFGKRNSSVTSSSQAARIAYPADYSAQCAEVVKGLKASKGDFDAIQETGAEDLFLNSVQWINDGVAVELSSLLKLIKAIKNFVLGDSWIEANEFRVHYDLYSEGITRVDFFLDPANAKFLLELIGLGEDGNHFACCLLQDLGEKLPLKFLQDLLELLIDQSEIYECTHWQETPVPGSPFIELIKANRLSGNDLDDLYEHVASKKLKANRYLISLIELYLSLNRQTSEKLLKEFIKNDDAVWAWVELDGTEVFSEVVVADYAQRAIATRKLSL